MFKHFKNHIEKGSEEESLLNKIEQKKIPVHVAIIMDGNGRWAKKRGLDRIEGHLKGAESARRIAECSARLGIKFLTLFTFSTENWKRPAREVNKLMDMLYKKLVEEKDILIKNDIKLKILGEVEKLPKKLQKKLVETEKISEKFKKMQINLALSYGSRQEIVGAVRKIIGDQIPSSSINEKTFAKYLYTKGYPDPELLIRTSGEYRISNFLLFQLAYSELYFTQTLWPDFDEKEYFKAIVEFQSRQRRFGRL
jgi:undecaprenyl diphosphate synthase